MSLRYREEEMLQDPKLGMWAEKENKKRRVRSLDEFSLEKRMGGFHSRQNFS